ncbi:MAG: glycosyltransferase [Granulosicoccus sp.]
MSSPASFSKRSDSNSLSEPVIAFCIEELGVGGAERMLVLMANEFVERGWQVHMLCLARAGELADALDEAVHVHVLHKRPGIDIGLPRRLLGCLDQIEPDIINSHLWVANAWTRLSLLLRRVPVVVTEHSRDTWKSGLYRWIDKQLSKRTSRLVAVSQDTADFYQNCIGVAQQLVSIINNGVDTSRFAAGCGKSNRREWLGQHKQENNDQRTPFFIGTVGRLVSAKNHGRLIEATQLLIKDASVAGRFAVYLYIVGDGPERLSLQQAIDERGLTDHIYLMGTRHDIPDLLAAFDVFVLSSDREGHPLTALEAQAAGTPVVLTDAGGCAEAIASRGDQTGGELVSQDAAELARAVRQMILQPQLREERAQFARKYARENFDKRQMIDKYEAIFRDVLDSAD